MRTSGFAKDLWDAVQAASNTDEAQQEDADMDEEFLAEDVGDEQRIISPLPAMNITTLPEHTKAHTEAVGYCWRDRDDAAHHLHHHIITISNHHIIIIRHQLVRAKSVDQPQFVPA